MKLTDLEKFLRAMRRKWAPRHDPLDLTYIDEVRDCCVCKDPTHWTTPRGRPVHPTCEEVRWSLTAKGEARVLHSFASMTRSISVAPPPPREVAPIRLRPGQCSWCREPKVGFRITADDYYHCTAHMFAPFRWTGDKP